MIKTSNVIKVILATLTVTQREAVIAAIEDQKRDAEEALEMLNGEATIEVKAPRQAKTPRKKATVKRISRKKGTWRFGGVSKAIIAFMNKNKGHYYSVIEITQALAKDYDVVNPKTKGFKKLRRSVATLCATFLRGEGPAEGTSIKKQVENDEVRYAMF
jgi:hypothetical protein